MKFLEGLARVATAAPAALILGACSSNAASCSAPPATFNVPAIIIPTLTSPAPGETGVSTGPLDVTIGSAYGATALSVQDPNGIVTFATNFRQADPSSTAVRIGTFAQLAPHTTYRVFATIPIPSFPPNGCTANPQAVALPTPQLLGSFTTG